MLRERPRHSERIRKALKRNTKGEEANGGQRDDGIFGVGQESQGRT